MIGGTASVISGGKFVNGAETGAFSFIFNDWAHAYQQARAEAKAWVQRIGEAWDQYSDTINLGLNGFAIAGLFVPGIGELEAGAIIAEEALAVDVAKSVDISRAKYGEAADHIADAQKAGHPDVLTIARDGADANRKTSIGGLAKVPGKQLDEYPPAMFKEGGAGASVRAISPKNNMGAGACIGNACRGLANGEKVRIRVVD